MRRQRKTAFTLIELLVVIAIIAIIAAILFPVFAAARDKARQAACLSNLKQTGYALHMYLEDYDDRLPACCAQGRADSWITCCGSSRRRPPPRSAVVRTSSRRRGCTKSPR